MQSEKSDTIEMAKHEEIAPSSSEGTGREIDDGDLPLGKAIRQYPKIAGYACFVTLAILLWGYDLVIVGTVSSIPAFQ